MSRKTALHFLVLILITLPGLHFVSGQAHERPPITVDNAGQVSELAVLTRGWINKLMWTPNGESLAVVGSAGVWFHDVSDFDAEPYLLPGNDDSWSMDFNHDMTLIALGGRNSTVQVREFATGEVLREFECHAETGIWGPVISVAFSPDGSLLACGAEDTFLFDMATGELLTSFEGDFAVAFHPDGTMMATAGAGSDEIRLWDIDTFDLLSTFDFVDDCAWGVNIDFSPDGILLAAVGNCGTAHVWPIPFGLKDLSEPRSYLPLYVLSGYSTEGWDKVSFGPEWWMLVVGGISGNDVLLWDLQQSGPEDTLESDSVRVLHMLDDFSGIVVGVAYSPDGSMAAAATSLGVIWIWDTATGQELTRLNYNPGGGERSGAYHDGISITRVVLSPDGRTLAAGTGGYMTSGGTVLLWDVEQRIEIGRLPGSGSMLDMAYSPGGSLLAAVSASSGLRIWDTATWQSVDLLEDYSQEAYSVDFDPQGTTLAVGNGGTVYLWDIAADEKINELENEAFVHDITYSADGSLLAVACDNGNVQIWDVTQGELLTVLEGHTDSSAIVVTFSPDGMLLASGGWDDKVRLWNVGTWEEVTTIETNVASLAFSPDGSLLAIGRGWRQDTLLLWDVARGEQLAVLDGHTMSVQSVVFSADGSLLISAGWDGTVRLWGLPIE
jgi:WD40 repeat protein